MLGAIMFGGWELLLILAVLVVLAGLAVGGIVVILFLVKLQRGKDRERSGAAPPFIGGGS